MPFELKSPKRGVIVAYLQGDLSIEEIGSLNQQMVSEYLASGDDYYIIYEVSDLSKFPMEIQRLRKASEPIATHEGVKYQVVTGIKSPIFNFLFDMIGQLFRQHLKKTNDLAEALKFVDEVSAKA
jgi:hypothetical protein